MTSSYLSMRIRSQHAYDTVLLSYRLRLVELVMSQSSWTIRKILRPFSALPKHNIVALYEHVCHIFNESVTQGCCIVSIKGVDGLLLVMIVVNISILCRYGVHCLLFFGRLMQAATNNVLGR